uniref:Domain of unknown function DB domain-containing protein n=1 Tax=Panagrolaimus superbus TaxID=310955 RepID=A0A914ZDP4_9BILA
MNLTTVILFTILLLIASVAADLPSCSRARCSHCEADLIARLCPQACSTCPRSTLSTTFIAPPKASSIGSKPVIHGQANLNTNTYGELHPLPQAPGPQAQPNSQPIYQQPQQPAVNQFQQQPYYPQQPFPSFQQPQQPIYQPQQQQQQQQFQGFQQQQYQQPQQFGQSPFFNPFQPFLHQSYQAQTPYNPFTFPTFAPVTFAPITTAPITVTPTPPHSVPQPQQPLPQPQSQQLPTYPQQVAPQQPQQPYRIDNGNSQKVTYHQHRPQGQVQQSKPKQIYNNQQQLPKQSPHVVQPQPQPIQKPYQPQQQAFIPPPSPQVVVQTPQPFIVPQVTPAPQPPVYPVPQPAIATSIDAASVSAAGTSTSDKTCPRPNFEPCIPKELANDRFRNCCQRLGEGCASICSYDQTLANVQIAVLTGRCPLSKVADMMVCASGYEDASACCQAYGVFEPGFEQCRPYCNPAAGLPNDGMLAEKYRCLGKMNQIQRCFYVSQRP